MKKCKLCQVQKPLSEFYNNKRAPDGKNSRCKPCNRQYSDNWNKANPDKVRASWKKKEERYALSGIVKARRYGLTLEQFQNMVIAAGGKCKICQIEKVLYIDHDHATGKVRGLLCLQCNTALGNFNDNMVHLQNAIEYLRAFSIAV